MFFSTPVAVMTLVMTALSMPAAQADSLKLKLGYLSFSEQQKDTKNDKNRDKNTEKDSDEKKEEATKGNTAVQAQTKTDKSPKDFQVKLSQRKISSYARLNNALFDRAFDVGYNLSFGSSRNQIATSESVGHSLSLSTGLTSRVGAFVSVDSDRSRAYDSSFAPASVIFASESESVSAGLNYLVLHESPSFPEVVVGGSVVQSDSEGRETDGQGLSISFTRTLPSTSLNGSASLFRSKTDGFKPGYSRSLSFSYSLIMNHDLTAGVGYSLSKPNASVSSSSGFTSLYYRFWKDWVMNLSASQAFDESNSTFFSLGITHTLRQ